MTSQSVSQALTVLDAIMHISQHVLERRMRSLISQDPDASQQGDSCSHQRCQLKIKVGHHLTAHSSPEERTASLILFAGDTHREQSLRAEHRDHFALRGG